MKLYRMPNGVIRQFVNAPEGAIPLEKKAPVEKKVEPVEEKAVEEIKNKAVSNAKNKKGSKK